MHPTDENDDGSEGVDADFDRDRLAESIGLVNKRFSGRKIQSVSSVK